MFYRNVGGPLLPKSFKCDGNETSLSQCESRNEYSKKYYYYGSRVAIRCTSGMYQ